MVTITDAPGVCKECLVYGWFMRREVGVYNGKERVELAVLLGAHATAFQAKVLGILLVVQICGGRVGRVGTITMGLDIQAAIRVIGAKKITF